MRFLLSEHIQRIVGVKFSNLVHAIYNQDRAEVHTTQLEALILELEEYLKKIDTLKKQERVSIQIGSLHLQKVHPAISSSHIKKQYTYFLDKYHVVLGTISDHQRDMMIGSYLLEQYKEEKNSACWETMNDIPETTLWKEIKQSSALSKEPILRRLWNIYTRMKMIPYEYETNSRFSRKAMLKDLRSVFTTILEYERGSIEPYEVIFSTRMYRDCIQHVSQIHSVYDTLLERANSLAVLYDLLEM